MTKFLKASRLYWHFSSKAHKATTDEETRYYLSLTWRCQAIEFIELKRQTS